MLPHDPVGRCCASPRFNTVGGIDERNSPGGLGTALRRKMSALAGDHAAAGRVEPVLPETGVCSGSAAPAAAAKNCCGGPALSDVDACCAAEANAKPQGKTGRGCA